MGFDLASVLRACGARAAALVAAGLLLPGLAQAFAPDPISVYGNGRTTIQPTVTNPNWTAGFSGSNAKFSRNFEMAAPAGKKVPVSAYVTVPPAGVNGYRRFLGKALKAVPLVGTGLLVVELWDMYRCRKSAGDAECDPGVPTTLQVVDCWKEYGGGPTCYPSAGAAASAKAATYAPTSASAFCFSDCSRTDYQMWKITYFDGQQYTTPAITIVNYQSQQQACENGVPPDIDGKCPSGQYEAKDLDYMEARLQTYPPTTAEQLAALNAALDYIPYDIDGNPFHPRVEGTPNVQGNTTTTTGPNGTTSTTEVYTPDETNPGYVDWTKQTTKTNPDNTTETTTETKPNEADPCKGAEGTLGCTQVGEIPTAAELPSDTVNVSITPQSGWGADNASCPAFASATFMGQQIQFDHSIICNFASGIRPAIIGVAWLIAALIVVGVRTSGEG